MTERVHQPSAMFFTLCLLEPAPYALVNMVSKPGKITSRSLQLSLADGPSTVAPHLFSLGASSIYLSSVWD
jgi:hypothetical protein